MYPKRMICGVHGNYLVSKPDEPCPRCVVVGLVVAHTAPQAPTSGLDSLTDPNVTGTYQDAMYEPLKRSWMKRLTRTSERRG